MFYNPDNESINRYSGKLLLRREIPVDEATFKQLLHSSFFTPRSSIKKKYYQYQCQRCGNCKRSLFGSIPCNNCEKTHLYCRKCIEMGRVMECEPLYEWTGPKVKWPAHINACTWKGELTEVQQKAADRITEAICNKENELLVWAVCGAGKTEMLFPGIAESLKRGKRICVATPRTDVVRELLPRLREAFSGTYVQGLYGGSRETDGAAQLVIATTHQLLRFKNAFDVIIIDEIDAFPYHADKSLSYAANRSKREDSNTTIYLTATPRQKHQILIARKKLQHIFVPSRFHGYPLPVPAFHMCYSLQKDMKSFQPPKPFFKWYAHRKTPNHQLLIFVPTIILAEKLYRNLLQILDDNVVAVHASDSNREEKIRQFRNKQIRILVTTTILERGVTFPAVDVVVFDAGHTVFDEAALVQIAGRAGRSPKDPTGEVVFFHNGKTEAMVQAVRSIQTMNKRGGFR
ncbi:competence protein ComFA [Virgibacillus salinus]|uniref:Competence protein ComFA n=2 Tax=Virgibacillus salinus TaxID=553311 RepID=A0A1H0ZCE3_9BACI|nr:competence protein ComFA [Virgibacillus salinus]